MLKFSRNKPKDQPERTVPPVLSRPAADAGEKAQALLAMLGDAAKGTGLTEGSSVVSIPPERLQRMARELVVQVEARKARRPETTKPAQPEFPFRPQKEAEISRPSLSEASQPSPRRSLFSNSSPLTERPAPVADPAAYSRPLQQTRPVESFSIPAPLQAPPHQPHPEFVHSGAETRRLVRLGMADATREREHPAVIALTLEGLPSRDQATAIRKLPRGQVRAVHRALRQLEAEASGRRDDLQPPDPS